MRKFLVAFGSALVAVLLMAGPAAAQVCVNTGTDNAGNTLSARCVDKSTGTATADNQAACTGGQKQWIPAGCNDIDQSGYTSSNAWDHAMNVVNALLDTIWGWLPIIMPLLLLIGLAFGLVMIVRSRMPG